MNHGDVSITPFYQSVIDGVFIGVNYSRRGNSRGDKGLYCALLNVVTEVKNEFSTALNHDGMVLGVIADILRRQLNLRGHGYFQAAHDVRGGGWWMQRDKLSVVGGTQI